MDEKFQCEYAISKRWAEAMFWRRVPLVSVFTSALFSLVLFGLAWYVKTVWLKIVCLVCGLGLVVWNVISIGKHASREFQGNGHVAVTIENDEVRLVLTLENQPEKCVTQSLSQFGAFRRRGKWLLLKRKDQSGDLYVCGSSSELRKLAALLKKRLDGTFRMDGHARKRDGARAAGRWIRDRRLDLFPGSNRCPDGVGETRRVHYPYPMDTNGRGTNIFGLDRRKSSLPCGADRKRRRNDVNRAIPLS